MDIKKEIRILKHMYGILKEAFGKMPYHIRFWIKVYWAILIAGYFIKPFDEKIWMGFVIVNMLLAVYLMYQLIRLKKMQEVSEEI